MQMAMMMKKLKAAEPTIVPGPRSPASNLFPMISITESKISGAEKNFETKFDFFSSLLALLWPKVAPLGALKVLF